MKNIVVTTDLSEESKAAFELALQFAKAFHGTIHLLAVVEDPAQAAMLYALDFPVSPIADVQHQLRDKVRADLDALSKQYFTDVQCIPHVIEASGAVHDEIIDFAQSLPADLLVISSHGRAGLSRLLIGSVVEKVVRECPCPVVTVPSRARKDR